MGDTKNFGEHCLRVATGLGAVERTSCHFEFVTKESLCSQGFHLFLFVCCQ